LGIGFEGKLTYRYPVPEGSKARLIVGVLVGLGLAAGCRQLNASHCGNQDGDATCLQRNEMAPYCDRCSAVDDGCVATPVREAGCGEAETSSNPATTTSATIGSSDAASSDAASTAATEAADGSSTGEPSLCGNGMLDADEPCDGEMLPDGTPDCMAEGFGAGEPVCLDDCTLDYTDCPEYMLCGNGEVGFGEQCDGRNLGGRDCTNIPNTPNLTNGALACNADCTFDTSGCLACAENNEPCTSGQTLCCDAPTDTCGGLPAQCCHGLGCLG
jgi:hypothetical protein